MSLLCNSGGLVESEACTFEFGVVSCHSGALDLSFVLRSLVLIVDYVMFLCKLLSSMYLTNTCFHYCLQEALTAGGVLTVTVKDLSLDTLAVQITTSDEKDFSDLLIAAGAAVRHELPLSGSLVLYKSQVPVPSPEPKFSQSQAAQSRPTGSQTPHVQSSVPQTSQLQPSTPQQLQSQSSRTPLRDQSQSHNSTESQNISVSVWLQSCQVITPSLLVMET